MNLGWVKSVKKMPGGGRLEIHHRPGDDVWVGRVESYWLDRLAGLALVQSSKFATVHRDTGFFYKRYHRRDWRDTLKHLLFPSRARRALAAGEQLEELGFHAPRAVCLVEERRGCWVRASALITEAIENAPNMRDWLNAPELGVAGSVAEKRKLLDAFGREVGRWHAAGLHHGDLRIGNILCRRKGNDFEMYWLDNEGNERAGKLPARWRIHNLMQVNMERTGVTRPDRMRFWRAYAAAAGVPSAEARDLQRRVQAYTLARWRERGWHS